MLKLGYYSSLSTKFMYNGKYNGTEKGENMVEFSADSMEEVMERMEEKYGDDWYDKYSIDTNAVSGGAISVKVLPLKSAHVNWDEVDELVEKELIIEDTEIEETYEELMSQFSELKIVVSVDSDEMKAFLSIYPGSLKEQITYSVLKEELEKAGVVYGIDEDILKKLTDIDIEESMENILIAQGKSPTPSSDTTIKFLFPKDGYIKIKKSAKETINYSKTREIFQCQKDDKLVERIPGTQGEDGITVTGNPLPAQPSKDINLKQLIGNERAVELSTDQKFLLARKKGQPYLSDLGKIHIREVFIVNKSIDYSVGDIVFDGTVIIHGDVDTPFEVHAKGDILIEGLVRDTRVFGGGFINIMGGASGRGNGVIECKKSLTAKYLNNITIFADEDCISNDYILNSKVYSGGNIIIHGRSIVTGGVLMAEQNISVKVAGNIAGAKTVLGCGIKYNRIKEEQKRNLKVGELLRKLGKISSAMEELRLRLKRCTEKEEQISITKKMAKLKLAKKKYFTTIKNIQSSRIQPPPSQEKKKDKSGKKKPTIYILEHGYPGTIIQIHAEKVKLPAEIGPTQFRYMFDKKKIAAKPYGQWKL